MDAAMVRSELKAIQARISKLLEAIEETTHGYTWAVRAVLQDHPGPFPARDLYRRLQGRTAISQRDLPAHLKALGYQRRKTEAGIVWVKKP